MNWRTNLRVKNLLAAGLALGGILLAGPAMAQTNGPDVTVYDLMDIQNYGTAGGIRGYAVGTRSCNIGNQPLNWCDVNGGCGLGTTNKDHPVIAQNMYRLKDGRFEQIGASWLKHGFESTNSQTAGCGNCVQPPLGPDQLGTGCTDPYQASLNGSRPMGRKSEVNPANGAYPFPPGGGGSTTNVWNQRMAVAEADMSAALNPGATYYVEGHYVAPDDATSGNGLNNAGYRRVTVGGANFTLTFAASTVRERSAIEAWPVVDNTVLLLNVDLPTAPIERFHVARKVTDLGGGVWHYEYAVHNMNSERAADQLTITFGEGTAITNIGFHDVNAHSNEPYDTTDWESATTSNSVSWTAPFFTPAENANALRWATMYNFFFDASRPPTAIASHSLSLFEAGLPEEVAFLEISQEPTLFADGFESGDTSAWTGARPAAGR
jgi:hypothetical protein